MKSLTLRQSMLLVFLIGGSAVTAKTSYDATCSGNNCCQAIDKLMAAVSELNRKNDEHGSCYGVNEKIDQQGDDLEELKTKLDANLASTAAISKQLERLSADLQRHDDRLKAHVESTKGCGCSEKLRPSDCADIRANGHVVSGIYRVYPGDESRRVEADVYCDFSDPKESWLVFQRRKDGSVDFDRTWGEYESGFGDLASEFWLGNDKLSLLTLNKKYKLRIDMEDFDGVKRWAEFSTFSVKPASDRYRLTAYGITGNAREGTGDSMAYYNGYQFSTLDNDNGLNLARCANQISGGWWFNECLYVNGNLNARYKSSYWYYEYTSYWSLKATEMKIAVVQ